MKKRMAVRNMRDAGRDGIMRSYPKYESTPEARVVDLSPDGIDCITEFGEHNYKQFGGGTVPHVHPGMIEIIFCRRGANLSFCNGDKIIAARPGSVLAAQPQTPHFLRLYPKGLSTTWIWFRIPEKGKTVLGLSAEETQWLAERLESLPVHFMYTPALGKSFRRLWHIYDSVPHGTTERRLLLRDAVTRLLLDVTEAARAGQAANAGVSDKRLDALIDEMRRDPSRNWTIDELAERAALSSAKLTISFRRQTGLPPHAFLVFCRVARAKELLAKTVRSVAAVANELGFQTAQHFAAQFHRETGFSPREYRAAARREKAAQKT